MTDLTYQPVVDAIRIMDANRDGRISSEEYAPYTFDPRSVRLDAMPSPELLASIFVGSNLTVFVSGQPTLIDGNSESVETIISQFRNCFNAIDTSGNRSIDRAEWDNSGPPMARLRAENAARRSNH